MSAKPSVFRIRPERSLYYTVRLWPTKAAMLDHLRSQGLPADPRTVAQCSTYRRYRVRADGRMRLSPCLGEIHLRARRLTTEVLVHEVAHAAQGWARRIGLDPRASIGPADDRRAGRGLVPEAEERYCHALGRMAAQLNDHLHRRKAWSHVTEPEFTDPDARPRRGAGRRPRRRAPRPRR